MSALTALLQECGVQAFPTDRPDVLRAVCPTCKTGAAEITEAPGDLIYVDCPRCGGWSHFSSEEFRSRFANGEAAPVTFPAFPRSDAGNAEALVFLHGDVFRYVHGPDLWRVWDGKRWRDDVTGAAERAALEAMRERLRGAADLAEHAEAALEAKWALGSQSARRIRDALTVASTFPAQAITADKFDSDPYLLNCANGIIDLRTGNLRPHDPGAMCAKLAPVDFDPDATCPRFEQFLREVFDGNGELEAFLQRWVGYSLTGLTQEQCFTILYGLGCNGKTTLLGVVKRLAGDYVRNADFATFGFAREKQAGVRDDIAALAGARIVTASEPSVGLRLSEGLVKQLTGSDPVTARALYGRHFDFVPQFKLWLSCNHRPTVRDTSLAFWRRVHLIPFGVSFKGREDPHLPEKLAAEAPGILNWAILGALEWQDGGLAPPEAVKAATADYQEAEDVIGAFVAERTEADPGAIVLFKTLRDSYLGWCDGNSERPLSSKAFGEALAEKGFGKERGGGGVRRYAGLRLVE